MGPSGEIIMDYSIHDALEAGFNKIVFIIRKDIEEEFREVIGNRIEKVAEVEYVFQDLQDLPEGFTCRRSAQSHGEPDRPSCSQRSAQRARLSSSTQTITTARKLM